MRLRQYLNEDNNSKKVFEWLNNFILTSKTKKPSKKIINFLKKYPIKVKSLYRGMGLIRNRIDKKNIEFVNNLSIGDDLPLFLKRPTGVSSYSKLKSIAKSYSEGTVSIITQTKPDQNKIIVDLEQFAKVIKKEGNYEPLDEEDLKYMEKDKEVIVMEPVREEIIFIKGKL